jgi:Zn-dependent protease
MDFNEIIKGILVFGPPTILAITLHEAAHGYVARRFGDSTAYLLGRVTLNPVKHIDIVGTIVVPLVIGFLSNWRFMFGWAKPVPVNFNNLRNPKRDMLWVAAAGPLSNVAQALAWAGAAKLLLAYTSPTGLVAPFWVPVAFAGISVNIVFAILNLLPILPLDGGRMLASVLPGKVSYHYQGTERYGMIILLALVFTGVLGWVMAPLVGASEKALLTLFGFI